MSLNCLNPDVLMVGSISKYVGADLQSINSDRPEYLHCSLTDFSGAPCCNFPTVSNLRDLIR